MKRQPTDQQKLANSASLMSKKRWSKFTPEQRVVETEKMRRILRERQKAYHEMMID